MPRNRVMLMIFLAATALASGQEPVSATNDAPVQIKRDPFWPIGYQPREDARPSAATTEGEETNKAGLQLKNLTPEQQAAIGRKLKVSGIMKTRGQYTAFVNGRLVEAGDELTIEIDGQRLTLLVRTVSETFVQIEPRP